MLVTNNFFTFHKRNIEILIIAKQRDDARIKAIDNENAIHVKVHIFCLTFLHIYKACNVFPSPAFFNRLSIQR